MSIFIILLKQSRWLLASAMACSLVYGLVSVVLIAEINTALTRP